MTITLEKDGRKFNVVPDGKSDVKLREQGYLPEGEKPVKKPARKRTTKKKEEVEVTE